jgi:PTH1 family peptidyl-tRNA hydrolase
MKMIVGLGNPKKKYEKTRHNIGFRVIDTITKSQKSKVKSQNIIFLKPDTFMNNSGKAVQECLAYYKIPISNLIVIHDDIDLLFGDIRVSKNSSSAGHKGVQSIIDELKTKDFIRVRIGIKKKLKIQNQKLKINTTDFVLKNFNQEEEKELKGIIKKAVLEITQLL